MKEKGIKLYSRNNSTNVDNRKRKKKGTVLKTSSQNAKQDSDDEIVADTENYDDVDRNIINDFIKEQAKIMTQPKKK